MQVQARAEIAAVVQARELRAEQAALRQQRIDFRHKYALLAVLRDAVPVLV